MLGTLPSRTGAMRRLATDVIREAGRDGRAFNQVEIEEKLAVSVPHAQRKVRETVEKVMADFLSDRVIAPSRPRTPLAPSFRLLADPLQLDDEPILVHVATLRLDIPRTYDGLWALMRAMTRRHGAFGVGDILAAIGDRIDEGVIADYVHALERSGAVTLAVKVGSARLYRANLSKIETPRPRADGQEQVAFARRAHMWRAMKMLGYFTTLDLACHASLPELPVSTQQAEHYINALTNAGYLQMKERAGQPPLYRLKQTMNTGPCAPEVLRARFVWDPNTCRVAGDAAHIEEVRR